MSGRPRAGTHGKSSGPIEPRLQGLRSLRPPLGLVPVSMRGVGMVAVNGKDDEWRCRGKKGKRVKEKGGKMHQKRDEMP